MKKILSVQLPKELAERLEKEAKEQRRTKSLLVRKALEFYLDPAKTEVDETKSIWRPSSELPDKTSEDIYIRYNDKGIEELRGTVHYIEKGYDFAEYFCCDWEDIKVDNIEDWCTLTDLVNQQRDILARIEKLERLHKGNHI